MNLNLAIDPNIDHAVFFGHTDRNPQNLLRPRRRRRLAANLHQIIF
jgi:hypothetical protein